MCGNCDSSKIQNVSTPTRRYYSVPSQHLQECYMKQDERPNNALYRLKQTLRDWRFKLDVVFDPK